MRKQQLMSGIGASIGILILILDGKTAVSGGQAGVDLCLRTVIPSLFPFFLLSIILTNAFMGSPLPLLRPLAKLFSIPNGAESILVCALFGGYPVGAQCISQAYREGQISRNDAQRMLAYCNNAGPAFLFGMIGGIFPDKWTSWILWSIHLISALLVATLFPGHSDSVNTPKKIPISVSQAMVSAIKAMAHVCGWVILFRVIIAFLQRWILWILPMGLQVMITGLLELANGCCSLSSIDSVSVRFVLCSGMLAFGGVCVTMQTISVVNGLSVKYYFVGKGLQTVFSLLLAAGWIWLPQAILPAILLFILLISRKNRKYSRNPAKVGV